MTVHIGLLVLAALCFLVSAVGVKPPGRGDLTAAGLLLVVLAMMFTG